MAAPSSPGGHTSASWALPEEIGCTDTSEFNDGRFRRCKEICEKIGGPSAYLRKEIDTPVKEKRFAEWLVRMVPERDDLLYHTVSNIPAVEPDEQAMTPPVVLHVACFGFHESCSMNNHVGSDISMTVSYTHLTLPTKRIV